MSLKSTIHFITGDWVLKDEYAIFPPRYDPLLGYNIGNVHLIRNNYSPTNIMINCTKPSLSTYKEVIELINRLQESKIKNLINLTVSIHPFGRILVL